MGILVDKIKRTMIGKGCGRFLAMSLVIVMCACSARTRTSPPTTATVSEKRFGDAVDTTEIMVDIKDVLKEMTSVLVSIDAKMGHNEFEAQRHKAKESEVEVDE